jgi:hypothetical protein
MLKNRNKKQVGQGMTEYIIIVALVALSAILVFSLFGQTIRDQVGQMSSQVAGGVAKTGQTDASTSATAANNDAKIASGLSTYYNTNHSLTGQ